MPRKPRGEDVEILYLELPKSRRIKERLARQAAANDRTATAEAMRVLDQGLPPADGTPAPTPRRAKRRAAGS